jgi:hypothetical protein
MLDALKSIFRLGSSSVIDISGGSDYANLPTGFFRVITVSGKESLGFYDPATGSLSWDVKVKPIIVKDGKRVELNLQDLPLVKLNFKSQAASGVQNVGGHNLLDTATLDGFNGEFGWGGSKPKLPEGWS